MLNWTKMVLGKIDERLSKIEIKILKRKNIVVTSTKEKEEERKKSLVLLILKGIKNIIVYSCNKKILLFVACVSSFVGALANILLIGQLINTILVVLPLLGLSYYSVIRLCEEDIESEIIESLCIGMCSGLAIIVPLVNVINGVLPILAIVLYTVPTVTYLIGMSC